MRNSSYCNCFIHSNLLWMWKQSHWRILPPANSGQHYRNKKVPLAAAGITDYKMFFSFEKEPVHERRYKTLDKGKKILNLSPGYFTEADYLGRKYYLYDYSDSLKITAADSKKTVVQFIPPRRIMQIAAFQQRLKGKDFLVVQLEQFTRSNSSTLLIFDDKFHK